MLCPLTDGDDDDDNDDVPQKENHSAYCGGCVSVQLNVYDTKVNGTPFIICRRHT